MRTGYLFAVLLAAGTLRSPLNGQTAPGPGRLTLASPAAISTELNDVAVATTGPTVQTPPQQSESAPAATAGRGERFGSVYVPVDNWIYAEMARLYELGYADTLFVGLRPWTRRSVLHVLKASQVAIMSGGSDEAKGILAAILDEVNDEDGPVGQQRGLVYGTQSAYTRLMGISGTPLRDSYHLGETIANDYGRPYEHGFNAIAGFSTVMEAGRFSLYVRGEYQHAPSAAGYSESLASVISANDGIVPFAPPNAPQSTIPSGPIPAENPFRIVEATFSYHLLSHEISFGKSDAWLGPGAGGAMAWSNNAENIYSFRINRVEPLHIPLLSRLIGPVRYDFFYGSLKGHTYPNSPYVHSESFSFHPTSNVEFGFQRSIIFGGEGHVPVTLHTFLKGFFSASNTSFAEKYSRADPGARFSSFQASYRLPFLRHYATFYVDSTVHDDVSPIDAPRRAGYRTGIDISQIPHLSKLEFRVEAVSTDPGVRSSNGGDFFYYESIQRQGYTNKGLLLGDWIGREGKGGQAWLTWHLGPQEFLQVEYLNKKLPKDFDQGTTQNQFKIEAVKRFHRDFEVDAWVQYEAWKAPIYLPGQQTDNAVACQLTWFPKLHTHPIAK